MDKIIKSGVAVVDVLESWGVDHIYGIPGGSFNAIMNALYDRQESIKFIQVRHEETGALAAAAEAKLTGKIGVCFGTAGPGATHLFNGLYDAKMDKVPMLALVGQSSSKVMNYDYFQEMNENPMFVDVSVYNRTVMTPESLPYMVDDAIRKAYEAKGVSVITIPTDFGYIDIPNEFVSSARNHKVGYPSPDKADIDAAVELIKVASRPVIYAGQGTRHSAETLIELSQHFSMPIIMSVLSKGIVPDKTENFLGMAGRVATKPANEALAMADLILFIGSDFPFVRGFFAPEAKIVQIDVDPSVLGKRRPADVAILGEAGLAMRAMIEGSERRRADAWFDANIDNMRNWKKWLRGFEQSDDVPMRVEPVFKEINRIASEDAIFVCDVGNVTINCIRLLDMNGRQRFTTSGLFATMGYGVPGGIGAKLCYPDRQVFTLSGDGGYAMSVQDIITQVKYNLPIINIVFSNDSFGFIEAEQEDTRQPKFGVDLRGADYGAMATAMGARGFTVTHRDQLREVFDQAQQSDRPVVIDIKTDNRRPLPAEAIILDEELFGREEVARYKERYEVEGMPTLKELLQQG